MPSRFEVTEENISILGRVAKKSGMYGPSCTLACAEVARLTLGTPGYVAPEQGWAMQPTAPYKCDIGSRFL